MARVEFFLSGNSVCGISEGMAELRKIEGFRLYTDAIKKGLIRKFKMSEMKWFLQWDPELQKKMIELNIVAHTTGGLLPPTDSLSVRKRKQEAILDISSAPVWELNLQTQGEKGLESEDGGLPDMAIDTTAGVVFESGETSNILEERRVRKQNPEEKTVLTNVMDIRVNNMADAVRLNKGSASARYHKDIEPECEHTIEMTDVGVSNGTVRLLEKRSASAVDTVQNCGEEIEEEKMATMVRLKDVRGKRSVVRLFVMLNIELSPWMLSSNSSWTPYVVVTVISVSALGVYFWSRRKNYVKVGKISKLFFFPVKSLKAVEVTKGRCTKFGFEVNGFLDRSFMLVDENGVLISQREAPSLVLLTPHIKDNYLIISGPNTKDLKVEIKESPSPEDKIIDCKVHTETVGGIDCGDEAASWFQSYLKMESVRLVRFYTSNTMRKYTRKEKFMINLRKKHPAGFQDLAAFHVLSTASVDDISSKQNEKKITVLNFRPNVLVEGCEAYAEDSWKFLKFNSGAELVNLILTTRCLMTTNDPEKGILDQKEPMVSLRKYRIAADPEISKITRSVPCFGTFCGVLSPGEIEVGNDIFAVVGKMPSMKVASK